MSTPDSDIADGTRTEVTVEFVSRLPLDVDGTRIRRLLCRTEDGDEIEVLVAPGTDPLFDLHTGTKYRLRGVLGSAPPETDERSFSRCPDCGGRVRPGRAVDTVGLTVADAASELDLSTPFGVVDKETTVTDLRRGTSTEEYGTKEVPTPLGVCQDCGRYSDGTGIPTVDDKAV